MTDPIEQGALALMRRDYPGHGFRGAELSFEDWQAMVVTDSVREEYRAKARTVIEALQDPEFKKAYESAREEEGMTEEWKPPTVSDLIARLSTLDSSLPVVVAKDEEGNGFEFWGGDVQESLMDKVHRDQTWPTPEQWAAEMADPDSRFDPVDDAPPEISGDIERVIVVWP